MLKNALDPQLRRPKLFLSRIDLSCGGCQATVC